MIRVSIFEGLSTLWASDLGIVLSHLPQEGLHNFAATVA
jgi:hypothetical protein